MDITYIKDVPDADHQHLQSQGREPVFVEEGKCRAVKNDFLRFPGVFRTREQERIRKRESNFSQIDQGFGTPLQERFQKSEGNFSQIDQDFRRCLQDIQEYKKIREDIRTREQENFPSRIEIREDIRRCLQDIQEYKKIREDIRTPMQERFQKSKDKTTTTTKSRHSTIISVLLGSVFVASRFCSVGADFIPLESDLSLCKTDLSKLADTCDNDKGKAIQCVLNDEGELGIGCFSKIWVKQGYCPYFRKSFGILDIRPCLGNRSICPPDRDQYLSNEVYKYQGCMTYKSARVPETLKTQNTSSTAIRSSDVGDGKYIRPLWILLTLCLFYHQLSFFD